MENKERKEFWIEERNRAKYVIEKINKKHWDVLPPEYKADPERAIKHFLEEIKFADEKIKNFVIKE